MATRTPSLRHLSAPPQSGVGEQEKAASEKTRDAVAPSTRLPREGGDRLWETELLVIQAGDRAELIHRANTLACSLEADPNTDLGGLGVTLAGRLQPGGVRLAIVARSPAEAIKRLNRAVEKLTDPTCDQIRDSVGIYYFTQPLGLEGKVAFLFPGEGAQYLGMLRDVCQAFPEAADFVQKADHERARIRPNDTHLSHLFLIPPDSDADQRRRAEEELRRLDNTMLSVLVANAALFLVLERLKVKADLAAGHSMGEWAALVMAGAVPHDNSFFGRFGSTMQLIQQQEEQDDNEAMLLAVGAGRATITEVLKSLTSQGVDTSKVYLGMDNCPHQTVVIGLVEPMEKVHEALKQQGTVCERLSFRRPYHTPLFEAQMGPLRELFDTTKMQMPTIPVYSCTTAAPFPNNPDAIRDLAVSHWASPVRFSEMIENMHAAGTRLFVEVGPRGNLSAFVEDILRGKSFAALPCNVSRRSGLTQLCHVVGQLTAHHVEIDLPAFFATRDLQPVALPWTEPAVESSPEPMEVSTSGGHSGRTQVMQQYLAVMDQFLDVQESMTLAYLQRTPRGARASILSEPDQVVEEPPATPRIRPLLGSIIHHVPRQEIVVRRLLDINEDHFVLDHTVGGRQVSKVDPDQHGVPVMPMTFTLEMLAEAAGELAPEKVVVAIRDIRLLRWLAFDFDEVGAVEIKARLTGEDPTTGVLLARVEIRELTNPQQPDSPTRGVASGVVELADTYPPMPPASEMPVTNERVVNMTPEQVYHNLFHGEMFQGVRRTIRGGDEGIEAEVEVLPRENLFASTTEPAFQMDPVLLDVVLHPLATWHLHQPDLAGRIMLPVGLDRVEFYGPPAPAGTRFLARAWISETTMRSFSHKGETITPDGRVYIRLDGVRCWRFYVPFGEVNFHGPKDQYFLARRWTKIEEQIGKTSTPYSLVRLEIPADLQQPAMNRVTAQVTLSPQEMRDFLRRSKENDDAQRWLFDRIAAKDAIRLVWYDRTGERLFPADIECTQDAQEVYQASRRGDATCAFSPGVVVRGGGVVAALSGRSGTLGLAVLREGDEVVLQPEDQPHITKWSDSQEGGYRLAVARAVANMAWPDVEQVKVGEIDRQQGTVLMVFADGSTRRIYTALDGDLYVGWTLGERA